MNGMFAVIEIDKRYGCLGKYLFEYTEDLSAIITFVHEWWIQPNDNEIIVFASPARRGHPSPIWQSNIGACFPSENVRHLSKVFCDEWNRRVAEKKDEVSSDVQMVD